MRSFFAAVAALLALLLAAVAVPAIWAERNIVQESGFVAMASPIGSNPAFKKALSTAAANTVSTQLHVASGLRQIVQPIIEAATTSLTSDPGYPAAWTQTLRRSHTLSIADAARSTAGQPALTLDVAPMLALVVKKVTSGLGSPVAAPAHVLISVGTPTQRSAMAALTTYAPKGYWAAWGAGLVFLLAVVIARRRSTTLLLTGLGLAAVAGAWKLGLDQLGKQVLDSSAGNQVAELFTQQYWAAASASFGWWIIVTLLAAGVLVIAGGLGRIFARS